MQSVTIFPLSLFPSFLSVKVHTKIKTKTIATKILFALRSVNHFHKPIPESLNVTAADCCDCCWFRSGSTSDSLSDAVPSCCLEIECRRSCLVRIDAQIFNITEPYPASSCMHDTDIWSNRCFVSLDSVIGSIKSWPRDDDEAPDGDGLPLTTDCPSFNSRIRLHASQRSFLFNVMVCRSVSVRYVLFNIFPFD